MARKVTRRIIRGTFFKRDGNRVYGRASTNISVIRSIVKTANLCIKEHSFGTESKTSVFLLYIEGTVDEGILIEVQKRIRDFRVKCMLEGFVLEKQLSGKPHTFFPMSQSTERPDIVASQLFEGRVAIILDGSPKVIAAPDYLWISQHLLTSIIQIMDVSQ